MGLSHKWIGLLHECISTVRAFPMENALYLYFTTLKSHFSILTTHFYKTTPIPFSILQYITLKYYKIIPFFIFFFHTPTKPTAADQQQPPITPTPTPANPNPQPLYPRRQTQTHHNPFCLQPRPRRGREIRSGNPITAGKPKHKPHHRRQTQTETPSPPRTTITNRFGNNPSPKTTNPQPPPPSR
jgi:hypothetical protein